ncbi:O-linked N-acetylglucosamine transferase family protein [Oryzifoliimicrobium ureilyticus]|uniref:O-linked N-acetylglucosamine transferase, SPINDLY family protein n=1 Tax=Oryzifoliimicrobium ureilyticus TaxID=3113724 RepID=UPI0030767FC9
MNATQLFANASKDYQRGQYLKSLESLNTLVDLQKDVKTYLLLAKNLLKLGFKNEAATAYSLAGQLDSHENSPYTREAAILYFQAGNEDEALVHALRVMSLAMKDADLAFVLSSIYLKRGRRDLLSPFRKVISESSNAEHALMALKILSDEVFDQTNEMLIANLHKRFPDIIALRLLHLVFMREICDFDAAAKSFRPVETMLRNGDVAFLEKDNPFYHLHWCADERLNRLAGNNNLPLKAMGAARLSKPHNWGSKIRVGYVSSDFWPNHATMKLLQRILELHDRDRFEITLFCHTKIDSLTESDSDRSSWGEICTIRDMSDEEAAEAIRSRNIDIIVDLKGHTAGGRAYILNQGVAPIQISWLGFPGMTVNIDLDYIIGDHVVLPDASKPHFHEKFVRLPDSYQPNDPMHRPKPKPVTRAELGLPEEAFIFASFNGNRKITPEVVDLWANILRRAPNSVLWLMLSNPRVEQNLINQFTRRGIGRNRIILCTRVDYEKHIDRQQAADLGIDTFPVNGHTTTSEQLWGGLPVLTVRGTNFASRVSESLLNAIGLPELVASDLKAYEDMAVELANNRERVVEYKERLKQNAGIMPLFDADRFREHLEKAYEMMVERAKQGLEPDHIDVPALPARTQPFYQAD